MFLQTQKVICVSDADLYAGKICAALDRQHPRDLFDIKLLLENEGITQNIRQAFIIYLASSPRPMSELLSPNRLDVEEIYHKEFVGMTTESVSYEELCNTREQLISIIQNTLLPNEKEFLISLKKGEPKWESIPIEGIKKLPAIQWKLINIRKMSINDRKKALLKLEKSFQR